LILFLLKVPDVYVDFMYIVDSHIIESKKARNIQTQTPLGRLTNEVLWGAQYAQQREILHF
jgi:hypothetical protein